MGQAMTVRNTTGFLNPILCRDLSLFLLKMFHILVSLNVCIVSTSAETTVWGIFFLIAQVLFKDRLSSL